jgi:hypothetical protein
MTEQDLDARLAGLFADTPVVSNPAFTERVLALAAYDQAQRRARTRALRRIARETVALTAVLATFAILARAAPGAVELGDTLPLTSPAMLGVAMLGLWALVAVRPAASER